MKKVLSLLAVGAFAFTACTSDEVIDESFAQTNAIGFSSNVKKGSRAKDLTQDNLTKFQVYAYYTKAGMTANPVNVFDGEEVILSGTDWGYTNTRYWVPDATYYFYAYSCGNQGITIADNGKLLMNLDNAQAPDVEKRALNILDFKCDNTHQHDLIFASKEGYVGKDKSETATPANDKVGFSFNHILTKVNAVFSSEFAPGYDIVISNVKIENIHDKGSFNPKGGEDNKGKWTTSRTVADKFVELTVEASKNIASAAASADEDPKTVTTATAFVLPHTYAEDAAKITFTIEVKQGNDVFLSRNMSGTWKPDWKTGYSYTYKIAITGSATNLEPIVFETKENMNVDDWTSGSTGTVEMTFSAN